MSKEDCLKRLSSGGDLDRAGLKELRSALWPRGASLIAGDDGTGFLLEAELNLTIEFCAGSR